MIEALVDIAGVWGAVLATLLGSVELAARYKDKPIIKISAGLVLRAVDGQEPEYGTRYEATRMGRIVEEEMWVEINVANHGRKSLQIVAVFIENGTKEHQILSCNLPAVIDSGSRVSTRIQKEWIDDPMVSSIGVLDELGTKHQLKRGEAQQLFDDSRARPSNRKKYKKRDEVAAEVTSPVYAWQLRDRAVITIRGDGGHR